MHDFPSNKLRFIHTNIVTGLHSRSEEKKYTLYPAPMPLVRLLSH